MRANLIENEVHIVTLGVFGDIGFIKILAVFDNLDEAWESTKLYQDYYNEDKEIQWQVDCCINRMHDIDDVMERVAYLRKED